MSSGTLLAMNYQDLADAALEEARGCLDNSTGRLRDMAGDDRQIVLGAVQRLHRSAQDKAPALAAAEHLAYALLTVVFREQVDDLPRRPDA